MNLDHGYNSSNPLENQPEQGHRMYDSLFKSVQKQQKIEQLNKLREDELNYHSGEIAKKNEEKMAKAAEIKKATYRIKLQALKKNLNKTNFVSAARRQ